LLYIYSDEEKLYFYFSFYFILNHYELFNRRVIDIAGISGNRIKVYFNNKLIKENTFKSYIDLHYPNETVYFDESNERWTVGVLYKQDSNNEVISFVNSINTYRGGTHANHVMDNIIKTLINDFIKKKEKELKISPQLLKDNLVFFINSTLINPTFSSQTKDTCTSKQDKFGSKYTPQQAFLKKLAKCGIVEQIIELVKFNICFLISKFISV
jgi:DNA topoisomerase-2